jgi:hypothetical protein
LKGGILELNIKNFINILEENDIYILHELTWNKVNEKVYDGGLFKKIASW